MPIKALRRAITEETSQYLEGIGKGKIGRIFMGLLKTGVDFGAGQGRAILQLTGAC